MHHDCYHQLTRSRPVRDAIKICKLETAGGTTLIRRRITLLQRFFFSFHASFLLSQGLTPLQKYAPLLTQHRSPQDTAGLVPSKYLICGHQQSASQSRSSQLRAGCRWSTAKFIPHIKPPYTASGAPGYCTALKLKYFHGRGRKLDRALVRVSL